MPSERGAATGSAIPPYVPTVAKTRDITVASIVPSALGGVAAALVLSYFGAAGSLVGAALGPVVFLVVKEFSRGPTEAAIERAVRVPPRTADARTGRSAVRASGGRPRPGGGLRLLVATAVLATVIAVSVITIPELITGSSLTTDRQTTFFDRGSGGASEPSTPAAGHDHRAGRDDRAGVHRCHDDDRADTGGHDDDPARGRVDGAGARRARPRPPRHPPSRHPSRRHPLRRRCRHHAPGRVTGRPRHRWARGGYPRRRAGELRGQGGAG